MSGSLTQPPNTFEVNGIKYMSGKLNAFQQLHVLRKLGPILAKIGPGFMQLAPAGVKTNADGTTTVLPNSDFLQDLTVLAPALEALSEMAEADCDFVLQRCLSVTKRWQDPGAWVNVWNDQVKRLQFEDIDLSTMMQITIQVLGDSLAGFSLGNVPQTTGAPPLPQKGQSNTSHLSTVKIT